jgi:hypothetical protein
VFSHGRLCQNGGSERCQAVPKPTPGAFCVLTVEKGSTGPDVFFLRGFTEWQDLNCNINWCLLNSKHKKYLLVSKKLACTLPEEIKPAQPFTEEDHAYLCG